MPDIKTQVPKTPKTAAKPSRLSESASFKVGGTSYTPASLQTAKEQFKKAESSVKAQADGYRSAPNPGQIVSTNVTIGNAAPSSTNSVPQTGVQTSVTKAPIQTKVATPTSVQTQASSPVTSGAANVSVSPAAPKAPQINSSVTASLQTNSQRGAAAQSSVKTQMDNYYVKPATAPQAPVHAAQGVNRPANTVPLGPQTGTVAQPGVQRSPLNVPGVAHTPVQTQTAPTAASGAAKIPTSPVVPRVPSFNTPSPVVGQAPMAPPNVVASFKVDGKSFAPVSLQTEGQRKVMAQSSVKTQMDSYYTKPASTPQAPIHAAQGVNKPANSVSVGPQTGSTNQSAVQNVPVQPSIMKTPAAPQASALKTPVVSESTKFSQHPSAQKIPQPKGDIQTAVLKTPVQAPSVKTGSMPARSNVQASVKGIKIADYQPFAQLPKPYAPAVTTPNVPVGQSVKVSFRVNGTSVAPMSLQTATDKFAQAQTRVKIQTDNFFVKPTSGVQLTENVAPGLQVPATSEFFAPQTPRVTPTGASTLVEKGNSADKTAVENRPGQVANRTVSPEPVKQNAPASSSGGKVSPYETVRKAPQTNATLPAEVNAPVKLSESASFKIGKNTFTPTSLQTATEKVAQAQAGVKVQTEAFNLKPPVVQEVSPNVSFHGVTVNEVSVIKTGEVGKNDFGKPTLPESGDPAIAPIATRVSNATYSVDADLTGAVAADPLNQGTQTVASIATQVPMQVESGSSVLPISDAEWEDVSTALVPVSTALVPFSRYSEIGFVGGGDLPVADGETGLQPLIIPIKSQIKTLALPGASESGGSASPNSKSLNLKNKRSKGKGEALGILRVIYHRVEREFNEKEDLGAQTVGMAMMTGELALAYFKASQKATDVAITAVKGAVDAVKTAGKAEAAIKLASEAIKLSGVTPISLKGYQILKTAAKVVGLKTTSLGERIVHRVKKYENFVNKTVSAYRKVTSGIKKARAAISTGYQRIRTAATVVHNMRKVGIPLTRVHVQMLRRMVFHGAREKFVPIAKAAGRSVGKALARGGAKAAKATGRAALKGGKLAGKGALSAANAVAGGLMASEDIALQGVGYTYTASRLGLKVGIKTGKVTYKASKVGVKTAVKGGKAVVRGVQFLRKNGFKASVKRLGSGIANGFAKAGKSIVSAMVNLLKSLATKLMVPLLIGIGAAVVIVAVSGAVSSTGIIFGGVFSDKDTGAEVNVADYVSGHLGVVLAEEQARLVDEMQGTLKPSGSNDIIRIYGGGSSDTLLVPNLETLSGLIPSNTEMVNALGPVFNVVLLMDFELEPTDAEAQALVEEIATGIFRCDPDTSHIEYCGQALLTGEGEVVKCTDCNKVHAIKTGDNACPNRSTGYHSSYTAACCCKITYRCKGHKQLVCEITTHEHSDGCYETDSHGSNLSYNCGNAEKVHTCKGYQYCNGHTVTHFRFSADGMYSVSQRYFEEPMNAILAIPPENRTTEQVARLADLESYREIYQEMMMQFGLVSGYGMTIADLGDIDWVRSTNRKENQEVINLALSQVGVTGGYPYWSYFGFGSRVAWCGCFVHWCMRHTPSATAAWPNTGNNAYCPTIENWFRSNGRLMPRSYRNIVAGDVILFNWDGRSYGADHVGMVIGRDNQYVYTVEGNMGDAVVVRQYDLNSAVILGYCLMNY